MQPPVRIKIYGLIKITKRGYLLWLGFGAVGLLAMLAVWFFTISPETPLEKTGRAPLNPLYLWRQYGPWIIGVGFLLGVAEAYTVLKRFRQAEISQQQAAATPPTTPQGN